MLYRAVNAFLLIGLVLSLGCAQRKPKRNPTAVKEDSEVVEEQEGPIEVSVPIVAGPVPVPTQPVPILTPAPFPVLVPLVIPEDDIDECPVPQQVAETGEPCEGPDHFLSYPFTSLIDLPQRQVTLDDEFIDPTDFMVGDGVRLLNPATKYHLGKIHKPKSPKTHYLALSVVPDDTLDFGEDKNLLVFNQFRNHRLTIPDDLALSGDGTPTLELLVPSVKRSCPDGDCSGDVCDGCFPDGDHYLCYELDVEENRCLVGNATFKDQFIKSQIVDRFIPTRLCNPVNKTFNGELSAATDEETNHLVCYEVESKLIPIRLIELLNQLGEQKGFVRKNDEICVPSTKLILPVR